MGTPTEAELAARAQSNLELMNTRLATEGIVLTDAEKVKLDELLRRDVGNSNGGVLNGGLEGGAATFFTRLVKFLQEIPRIMSGGVDLQTAWQQSASTAENYSQIRGTQRGLAQLTIDLHYAGSQYPNLVANAERITGLYALDSTRTVPDEARNPNNLNNQALDARGQGDMHFANNDSLNIRPDLQPLPVTVNGPPLNTPRVPAVPPQVG